MVWVPSRKIQIIPVWKNLINFLFSQKRIFQISNAMVFIYLKSSKVSVCQCECEILTVNISQLFHSIGNWYLTFIYGLDIWCHCLWHYYDMALFTLSIGKKYREKTRVSRYLANNIRNSCIVRAAGDWQHRQLIWKHQQIVIRICSKCFHSKICRKPHC